MDRVGKQEIKANSPEEGEGIGARSRGSTEIKRGGRKRELTKGKLLEDRRRREGRKERRGERRGRRGKAIHHIHGIETNITLLKRVEKRRRRQVPRIEPQLKDT